MKRLICKSYFKFNQNLGRARVYSITFATAWALRAKRQTVCGFYLISGRITSVNMPYRTKYWACSEVYTGPCVLLQISGSSHQLDRSICYHKASLPAMFFRGRYSSGFLFRERLQVTVNDFMATFTRHYGMGNKKTHIARMYTLYLTIRDQWLTIRPIFLQVRTQLLIISL